MDQASSQLQQHKHPSSVDEAIAQEEHWIRIYEAEMALLSFKTNHAYENLERMKEDDEYAPPPLRNPLVYPVVPGA